jgi:hypothetical protein
MSLDPGRRKRRYGVLQVSRMIKSVPPEKKSGAAMLLQRSFEHCTGSGHRTTTSSTRLEAKKEFRF